ncbi:hypothetical protein A3Q56_08095 [Intoshia linei]|uniref:Dynein attachment factor N-terminal domain-containing protein n=1 Tax=Intoshia linei TaxID=1819745 RepID=A0A177AS34_9BILA|nr:hypothetical protein A3Q56_08095 [Intoshia linei]
MSNYETDINLDKLELEYNNDVKKDQTYWRENDAKFAAVHQKVENYEEFCDIVKASKLKPIDKNDITSKATTSWKKTKN